MIARIKSLEIDGRLQGVFDDRGKYLFLTTQELDDMAAWIQRRGRCSIGDIVAQANKIIDLSGSAQEEEGASEQLVLEDEEEKAA